MLAYPPAVAIGWAHYPSAPASPPDGQLKPLPLAAEDQERRRLEDLLETVGPAGRFPQTPQNCADISRPCALPLPKNFGVIFVPPFECELPPCCLSLFCRVL